MAKLFVVFRCLSKWRLMVLLIIGLVGVVLSAPSLPTNVYPECSDLLFTATGQLDIEAILYNCSNNIPGNTVLPSYYVNSTGGYSPTTVNIQLAFNNLISVDELQSQFTIDLYYRIKWVDPRWQLPTGFWDHLNVHAHLTEGLSILAYTQSQNPLMIYLPDVTFLQQVNSQVLVESLKILPGGLFFWSRHMVFVFSQCDMKYESYPRDIQTFTMAIQSYSSSSYLLELGFIGNQAVEFISMNTLGSTSNLAQNQLWRYLSSSSLLAEESKAGFDPKRTFSTAYINLVFERQSWGIIVRFIFPITLLLLLTGLTYWIMYENRVDTTITILVSASALYIVILQNIPNVGYLTDADKFVFWMFVSLIGVVASHQLYATMKVKVEIWPLRAVILRLIESVGRVGVPAVLFFYFQATIGLDLPNVAAADGIYATLVFAFFIKELFGVRNVVEKSIIQLFEKINREDITIKEISRLERIVLNLILFNKVSTSVANISHELAVNKKLVYESYKKKTVFLRHVNRVKTLGGGGGSSGISTRSGNSQDKPHMANIYKESSGRLRSNTSDGVELGEFGSTMTHRKPPQNPLHTNSSYGDDLLEERSTSGFTKSNATVILNTNTNTDLSNDDENRMVSISELQDSDDEEE
jgi:hypothetical protein